MINKIREARLEKLKKFINAGIDPYPAKTGRTHMISELVSNFEKFEKEGKDVTIAGRLFSVRAHGGSIFANISDESGDIQIYFKKDNLSKEQWEFLEDLDVGDFVETAGKLFNTKKGEKTLLISSWKILSKSLLPLPDKWYGLEDKEIRFRKRYLDLLMNKDVRERFVKRSLIVRELRNLLDKEGFIEVETPILQPLAGGAAAKPFTTHLNALDIDLYLRIAPELYLKRLIVGGFEKIYEIGRTFRNEGIDRQHNPDFTMCEGYWAFTDYNFLMEFFEKLLSQIVKNVTGGYKIKYQGEDIDFTPPWPRISFTKAVKDASGIDMLVLDEKGLREAMEKIGISTKGLVGFGKLADELYKEVVRKKITSPVFITDHPIQLGPLAKAHKGKKIVQRFQVVANGFELVNAYSELNDPIDQRERLEYQIELKKRGDDEAPAEIDEDYIEAMEYGMPPIAGWGIGVDRFAALLTDASSLKEIILFPTMRPDEKSTLISRSGESVANQSGGQKPSDKSANQNTKLKEEKDTMMSKKINITRDEALELVKEKVKNGNTIKHMLATEAIMRVLAKKFGEDEEIWGLVGLLHDGDMEHPEAMNDASKHGVIIGEELKERGVPEVIASAIRAHNEKTGEVRDILLKKAIYAVDPLTGLIIACALVRPDKKLASVDANSVMKKFKDKAFARGANREIIKSCQEFGLPLKEFIEVGLEAMKKVDKDLGV